MVFVILPLEVEDYDVINHCSPHRGTLARLWPSRKIKSVHDVTNPQMEKVIMTKIVCQPYSNNNRITLKHISSLYKTVFEHDEGVFNWNFAGTIHKYLNISIFQMYWINNYCATMLTLASKSQILRGLSLTCVLLLRLLPATASNTGYCPDPCHLCQVGNTHSFDPEYNCCLFVLELYLIQ
jgi:hypothetical protein